LLVVGEDRVESRYEMSPAQVADQLERRTWSILWEIDDATWAEVVQPVIDGARSLPDPDRPRRRVEYHDVLALRATGGRSRLACAAMANVEHRVRINRAPDEVWAVMGDFWALADWFPGVENCEKTSDDVRTIHMGDLAIDERLLERDERARSFAYTIDKSPMPLEFHRADWSVVADGDGSVLTVKAEVRPDDAMAIFDPVYKQAAEGLRDHIES